MVRQAPAQLLGHLEGQGLGALGVVGAQVNVDKTPAVGVGHLAAEAVHLVVVTLHGHQGGVIDEGAQHLPGFQIRRNEHTAAQSGMGRDGGGGIGQIAGGCTAHSGEAQLPGHGSRRQTPPDP